MADIIDGKAVANRVREEVRARVARLTEAGTTPGLAVVLVGDDEPSHIYVRHKARACGRAGIASFVHHLPAETKEEDILAEVERLNGDPSVHGILVQIPLPEGVSEYRVLQAIRPDKDVDAFHAANMGKLVAARRPALAPCTPKGVMRLLAEYDVPVQGAHAVVLGRSRVVGRPMGAMLLAADATVTTCHRYTADSRALACQADILVCAVGRAGLVRGDWVKDGAVVIDAGTRRVDGKLRGDALWEEVEPKARLITPVPGGVGPMTIAMLLENTCLLAEAGVGVGTPTAA